MTAAAESRPITGTVVHQHGIWTAVALATLSFSRRGAPVVIAAHGSLQPWTLRRSRTRKAFARFAYEGRNLRRAACLHATGPAEIEDFRRFGLRQPIALIPNGAPESAYALGDAERFRATYGLPADRRIMLYLGRVTPKKGLPMLVAAWASLRSLLAEWLLVVAGPDEFGHLAEVQEAVRQHGLASEVRFVGPQFDREKADAFAAAHCFVLPTFSEGAPIAVLEALAAGVPVLTTTGAPWEDLVRHGCGWWVEPSEVGLRKALREIAALDLESMSAMGRRGAELVRTNYSWRRASDMTLRLYEWLLHRSARPDFVVAD
jgi:glycosyltransferase involved in cell wall biosynthesis